MRFFGLLLIGILFCGSARARVYAADGDSLYVDNLEIRLSGIDAPERDQTCYDANNREYACGQESLAALRLMIGEGLRCEKVITDKYHRQVSVCWMGKININQKMVEKGWAVAYKRYTHEYDQAEQEAKNSHRGIWQGRFLKPEFYRILQKEKKKAQ